MVRKFYVYLHLYVFLDRVTDLLGELAKKNNKSIISTVTGRSKIGRTSAAMIRAKAFGSQNDIIFGNEGLSESRGTDDIRQRTVMVFVRFRQRSIVCQTTRIGRERSVARHENTKKPTRQTKPKHAKTTIKTEVRKDSPRKWVS